MKRLLTVALLCAATGALAADTKPAPKTAPKTETKSDMKPMADEGKNLKVEEPDQKDPKNKRDDVKVQGADKKNDL